MIKGLLAALFAVIVLVGTTPSANAYEVTPMRVTLVPAEGRTNSTITVNNIRDTELPVEIIVKRRIIAEDGTQSFVPADEDFIVFPPQIAIAAGKSQAFRFEYIGPPPTDAAVGYVIEVAEVPVVPPGFTGVQFAYNFGVAVYVEPPRAFAKLATKARIENGKLLLDVANSGSKYALLTGMELVLLLDGNRRVYGSAALAELIQNGLVPPGGRISFAMTLDNLPATGTLQAEFRQP
ncbi:fimbria/pilus periplasmic chaperone [Erythrobacter sp. T5W1-R]|uniref:fimbrial biogenesis chaperone n=1 Tax=Erythrobacter sp. T5W1-R TaxID=3101752 RepID=UPI002AFE48FA|nr:fimbria/pilus periplasmic chaperone [Erythrobacter sp. T5W1-R]MEA1618483.1 fimbria/pilus periplasmic chaperone [Erythrobacter sp. T5W1-R]